MLENVIDNDLTPKNMEYTFAHELFNCIICQIFERILYIWAIRHPASGYVQGINDLVTPFFVVFLSEYIENGKNFVVHIMFSILFIQWCEWTDDF